MPPAGQEQVTVLRANALIDTSPLPYAQVLNATEWRITRIRWEIRSPAGTPPNVELAPRFLDQTVFIEPHTVASLYLDLGRFGRDASITLGTAWGVREARD